MPRDGLNIFKEAGWPIKQSRFILATAVLIGTIVGAGIFAMPYAISKSGIIPGFFYFLILGGAVLIIHLLFAEVALRTKTMYGLVGFSQKYLGRAGRTAVTFSVVFGTIGVLLAYLILAGDFLKILFSFTGGWPTFYFVLIFWVFSSLFIFRGIKLIAPVAILTNFLFFFTIIIISFFALPKVNFANFGLVSLPNIFLPYGIVLFSLVGWSALPEAVGILKSPEEKRSIKKSIVISSIIVLALYSVFVLAVIGVAGKNVSPDAVSGLLPYLGGKIVFLITLAGAITITDSFLILALYLKNNFIYDFKFNKFVSGLVVCLVPLFLYLLGLRSFITVIGFVGTIIGAIEGITIVLIFRRAKALGDREPEYSLNIPAFLPYLLILIFILGAISQIFLIL